MSLLLLPGEAECRSPPRVRAAANHNPWFETAAGAESISQRHKLVTPPVRVYYNAVEDYVIGMSPHWLCVLVLPGRTIFRDSNLQFVYHNDLRSS